MGIVSKGWLNPDGDKRLKNKRLVLIAVFFFSLFLNLEMAYYSRQLKSEIDQLHWRPTTIRTVPSLKRGDPGINQLDKISKPHDIYYSKGKNLQDKWKADAKMVKAISNLLARKPGPKPSSRESCKPTRIQTVMVLYDGWH